MSICSYIWDSQKHLSNAAFSLELFAAVVEVVVAIVIVGTFHKEWNEKARKRLEFLFEVAFLVAALLVLVAIVSNRRLDALREKDEKDAVEKINSAVSNAVVAATNANSQAEKLASANLKIAELEGQIQPRSIKPEDIEKFVSLLKNIPKGNVSVCAAINSGGDVSEYAELIREMISSAGYNTGTMVGLSSGRSSLVRGVYISVRGGTNLPPFAGPMQQALKAIGIDAIGNIDDSVGSGASTGFDVSIFVGPKP